ncbi:hypothetical protein WA026_004393 [Henosepilachna vigintioctopunctata]|uniref:Cubilin n=1 Tax=Henosepilachna vigintioctopunctata TaxID=420089 RepID=A0AAW1VB67_9CUCU
MEFLYFTWCLLLNIYCVSSLNYFGPQPKIITEDGHLIFRAGEDRNITLQTKGKGKVQVNGVDLSDAAKMIKSASAIFNKYSENFEGPFNRIDKFEAILKGKNGILQRLTTVENECANLTISEVSKPEISRLSRQYRRVKSALISILSLIIKNECQSNPCANGAVCQDAYDGVICHCLDGWEGLRCDKDVNECARFVGTDLGCQNGATCINSPGSYRCICPFGWYGLHCTRRSKDCNSGSSSSLCGHGTCVPQNTDLGYSCICDQGWTKSGSAPDCSVDVDECKMDRPPCSVNPLVACQNTPGSFRCAQCPAGYTGNGFYCIDIDECALFNGGCSMEPRVECINIVGSRKCGACPPGYQGDGITCTYKGICNVNNGGCHPLATCKNNPRISSTYVECNCPSGYQGNGFGPNGCLPSTLTPCAPNPCKNGYCTVNDTSPDHYICRCKPSFFGKNCDKSANACASNPCKNGGLCLNWNLSFMCMCTKSWTGPTCNSERSACGGHLRSSFGDLKFPPGNFSMKTGVRSCAWVIETNTNKVLNITFQRFQLKQSEHCNKDWLQIHDGRNSASHIMGRFCGNDLPKNGTIKTSHNTVYIWYRTDGLSNSGFELSWNSTTPTCEYVINTTSHGTIQSPGSPGNYPNNRDCYWTLFAPTGKRLLFHFFSFDIGQSVNCSEDYLEFIPSLNENEKPLAKYCNSTTLPSPLYSPGPEVVVHFHSDEKKQHAGFQISYSIVEGIPGCGGVFTKDHGEIQSPSYKGAYMSDLSCEYKIKLAEGLRIRSEFISFDLEFDNVCEFDYVEIYSGPDTNSPLIGRYCGQTAPAPFISTGNELTIYLKTDWATDFKGFTMRYETVCGGKFTKPSGIIVSDGYPDRYTPGLSCLYEIVQPVGTIIQLSFSDFNLESAMSEVQQECYDYVEIRDGDNENSTLVGRYCDENKPPLVISSLNYLWIKFISDESVGGRGFKANYSTTNIGCGGILKNRVGAISSPGVGGYYSTGRKCTWVIAAPPGRVIQLTWITFQIEYRFVCDHDYVLVYDNNTNSERGGLIGRYCGNKLPPALVSTSNVLTIVFVSDLNPNTGGFTLSYHFVDEAKLCGGNFISPGGVLKSPGFPKNYPSTSDCTWTITVATGSQILLNITKFDIEQYAGCKYDHLEIRNGKAVSSPLIGRYCGNDIPKLITSHTNQIYIHFKSNTQVFRTGFEIIWESAATGCGGTLTAPRGSIASPMYPESYNRFTNCYWKITVSAGSLVQLFFSDIDLEFQVNCLLDFVEMYDGKGISSKSLGRFCGPTHKPFILSTQNHVFVHFRSDVSYQGRGFQLQYSTICRNNLTGFYGVIESPNFPNEYPLINDCTWNINVEAKNGINITFSHFDIRRGYYVKGESCDNDNYLEIRYLDETDTGELRYESYGKYCGNEVPKMITLQHDHAQIRYVTNILASGTGFRLEWVLEGCGGKLYRKGSIESPNYPKGYPVGKACKWELEADFGNLIEITFQDVDIEKVAKCEYDSIKVFNGPDDTFPLLGHFCHQEAPTRLTSIGNKMSVYFNSDISYVGKGFYANFTSVNAKCGGKMKISKGTLHSPNYPQNYDKNTTCEWLLEVDENHLIDLEFEDVQLLSESLCKKNYIKVYDGPSAAYPVLANICGNKKPNRTITSTHNTLTVEFTSSTVYLTSKGFKASFHKACGARIVASDTGEIHMDSQHDIERQDNCTWTILAPEPDEQVILTINHMNTPNHDCSFEHPIVIYNGESSNGTLMGQYCGTKAPPTLTSSGNSLHVVVLPDVYFFATYTVYGSRCGGLLASFEGNFATPGYPTVYPLETECEWTLHAAPGNHISLNFKEFDIPQSEKCKTDYLEIRSNNSSGKILGIYCGNNKPDNITNIGSLWIYFKSSKPEKDVSVISAKGFIAEYILDHDNVISAASGSIANPLYPAYFWSSGEYTWRISVMFGKKISFTIKELFLESYDAEDCSYSGLKIYDGIDSSAPQLLSACGFKTPSEPIKTSSNEAYIIGSLNAIRTGAKFLIEWQELQNYMEIKKENNTIEGCGSKEVIDVSNLTTYTLKSPGYPGGYANNLNCEWMFSTSPMNHLIIFFESVDLESYYGSFAHCFLDHIEIYFGKDGTENWQKITDVCTDNGTIIVSKSNLMKVKFVSNYHSNGTGFLANIHEVCGGTLIQSEGYIKFTDKYPRGRKCEWNITVGSGRTIKVDFPLFNIAPGQEKGCRNHLTMRNGHLSDSPLLGNGQYCGNSRPVLTTTSNRLNVKYSGASNVKGFILHFEEVSYDCGGNIELTTFKNSTTITSPNYPNIPPPHIDCIWRIRSPAGTSVQVDFQDRFDLTKSDRCVTEAVEMRNGATELSPIIGRFCKTMPGTQYSTDNTMYLKYFTNTDDPKNGFKATLSLASCGGTLRGKSGQLHWSSTNKGVYQNNNCTWHIVAPEDYTLRLKLSELHFFLNFLRCSKNSENISIYSVDSLQRTETLVKNICNGVGQPDLLIGGNEAIIKFTHGYPARSPQLKSYFTISYTAIEQNCTFNLDTSSGTIKTPSYPRHSYSLKNCKWYVKVPEGRRITLRMLDLDLDETASPGSPRIILYDSNMRLAIANIRNNNLTTEEQRVFKSSSNTMLINFWCINCHGRGFSARYNSDEETVCRGSFNESSGLIPMPTEPKFSCSWKRTQDEGNTVKMSFQMYSGFKTLYFTSCYSFSGGAILFSEYGQGRSKFFNLCSNTTNPVVVTSSFPKLSLQVWGKRSVFNYSISYDTYKCGAIKTTENGVISSPNFPNKPSSSMECSWLIALFPDQQINLTFTSFDLGDDCDKSFVEIYNGKRLFAPKIGTFCKDKNPVVIHSERNFLLINYHFEDGSKGKGFNATYQPIIEGCGGIFHSKNRIIQTPDYPNDYPNNTECVWEIRADEGYHIGFSFIGRFHLEESDECADDYLKIWDWKDDQWVHLKTLCGRETPNPVNSTGNRMKVMFRSNNKIRARGFKAKWDFNCGGMPSCVSDNMTIKGLSSYYLPHVRSLYCGDAKPSDMRHKGGAKITFISDSWVVKSGYRFSFRNDGCGGNITSPTKISTSMFKSSTSFVTYGRMRCQWDITAPNKKIIVLRFESLQTPYTPSCSYDNVVVYGGHIIQKENKLASFCGNLSQSLPTISSINNTATILSFVDPLSSTFKFSIDIFFTAGPLEGCGGTFNLTSTKIIQSPSVDEIVDCNWNFIAPVDNQIEFELLDLNLPGCKKEAVCSCSFIELRDGGSALAILIKKLCNHDNLSRTKFYSSTRYGFLRYHQKGMASNAFRISVKPIPSKCGESVLNVTSEVKTLISPNYPNQYPENMRCSWLLRTTENYKKFVLRFIDFELSEEGTESIAENVCKNDYLEIEDGNQFQSYAQSLGPSTIFAGRGKTSSTYELNMRGFHTFCGRNGKPFDYFTATSAVTLILQSKYGNNRGKGFKVEYQFVGCNRNYTEESGKIRISVGANEDCIVGVNTTGNRTISFYFSQFYSSYSTGCTDDSLSVLDGDLKTGKEVGKWCGYDLPSPVFSKTNMLWLKVKSKKDYSLVNVNVEYTTTDKGRGCGGSFYDVSGKFSSPLYPNDYRNDTLCKWQVRGPKGSRYYIHFSMFDIQAPCQINHIEVTTYEKTLGNIHRFCKNDNPADLYSDGKFEVSYLSSIHNGGRGWVIEFKTTDTDNIPPFTGHEAV